ncbi:MAG: membrane protein insertion efficiency factor YidD [Epsilonproteobacteria bacterium]|nr:membrane protein insertion efficiency factor YidD [Campylobacterota bacterium]
MSLKKLPIALINAYRYISPAFGQKCRYYPTCSEYAIWEFETDNPVSAFIKSALRILRCNQLFKGGIDYPLIKKNFTPMCGKKMKIKYWLIPKGDKFIVIKVRNER